MLVLGLLLVVAGAVTAGYLLLQMSNRTAAVVVIRDVPVGTQITSSDVGTARVATDTGMVVIPGQQLAQVVGRFAAVDLRKGSLLLPSQLTSGLSPRPGQQVVPVALKLEQVPARGLRPGDQVLVVATPGQAGQDPNAGTGNAALADTPATVDQVSSQGADNYVRVDLVVDATAGSALAKQASTGRIAVVVTSRGGS